MMKRNVNPLILLSTAFILPLFVVFSGFKAPEPPSAIKWIQLFNGKNLNGWQPKIRYHAFKDNFANTFRVQHGNIEVRSKTFNGEQWVRVEVLILGDSLAVHYVNRDEVLRYERPQLDPVGTAAEGELLKGGTISLQSESHPVDFRKVELINLEKYAGDQEKLKKVIERLMSEKRVAKQ